MIWRAQLSPPAPQSPKSAAYLCRSRPTLFPLRRKGPVRLKEHKLIHHACLALLEFQTKTVQAFDVELQAATRHQLQGWLPGEHERQRGFASQADSCRLRSELVLSGERR